MENMTPHFDWDPRGTTGADNKLLVIDYQVLLAPMKSPNTKWLVMKSHPIVADAAAAEFVVSI